MTEHPHSVGETYGEHLRQATSFGAPMVMCGLACMVHGFLPFLFKKTGSRMIRRMHERLERDPQRCAAAEAARAQTAMEEARTA